MKDQMCDNQYSILQYNILRINQMSKRSNQDSTGNGMQGCQLSSTDILDHSDQIYESDSEPEIQLMQPEESYNWNLEDLFSDQWMRPLDNTFLQGENESISQLSNNSGRVEEGMKTIYPTTEPISPTTEQIVESPSKVSRVRPIRRQSRKNFNKKNNIPKFLMRVFCKRLPEYKHLYGDDLDVYAQVRKQTKNLERWTREKKANFVGLEKLKEFFGRRTNQTHSYLNRRAMSQIMEDHMLKEIIGSAQIKNHALYLQAAKVFRIRCRNTSLAERNQCD